MKKHICSILAALTALCSTAAFAADIPTLHAGYTITTHQESFMVAMVLGDKLKNMGVWLEPIVEKEKYYLYKNGEKVAKLNVIVTKSGSEATTLFAQGHLDLTTNSFPAMLSGIDRGTAIKVLAPLQADGVAMVARTGLNIKGWKAFKQFVQKSQKPVIVGYHSPTSAPKILFEAAMAESGLKITEDANATKAKADILMMDLKGLSNVIPAMTAKQVDFAVVPAPTPEIVEYKKQGTIVLQLSELPPAGKWKSFPCCCIAGRTEVIEKHPKAVKAYVELLSKSSEWCTNNKHEAAEAASSLLGIPVEVIEKAKMEYSTKVTKTWLKNAAFYPDMLNKLGKMTGKLKGKKLNEVKNDIFDFRFTAIEK
ncbi:MAG: ABC transporter substrate-binding protein [Synergistaceae bacterium]|nr:ABC transporter substrate-binding protein [Synergistaceae bacterium]